MSEVLKPSANPNVLNANAENGEIGKEAVPAAEFIGNLQNQNDADKLAIVRKEGISFEQADDVVEKGLTDRLAKEAEAALADGELSESEKDKILPIWNRGLAEDAVSRANNENQVGIIESVAKKYPDLAEQMLRHSASKNPAIPHQKINGITPAEIFAQYVTDGVKQHLEKSQESISIVERSKTGEEPIEETEQS